MSQDNLRLCLTVAEVVIQTDLNRSVCEDKWPQVQQRTNKWDTAGRLAHMLLLLLPVCAYICVCRASFSAEGCSLSQCLYFKRLCGRQILGERAGVDK